MKMPEYVAVKIMPDKKGTSYNLEVVTDADFVNVVRCKECKYADKNGEQCLCKIPDYLHWHESDFFCAYGEKVTE